MFANFGETARPDIVEDHQRPTVEKSVSRIDLNYAYGQKNCPQKEANKDCLKKLVF